MECEYYTLLQIIIIGSVRTKSSLPSNLVKMKIFLMKLWNFLRKISGKRSGKDVY